MDLISSLNSFIPLIAGKDIVLLVVRLIFGMTFIYYGWPKLKDLKSNAADFEKMGFKPGWFWGTPIALLEVFGGIAVILGFFTGIMAAGFAFHMTVGTVWKITKTDKPFSDWSYDLLLLSISLLLLTTGPGNYNILFA